jgi:hypothetical protein
MVEMILAFILTVILPLGLVALLLISWNREDPR